MKRKKAVTGSKRILGSRQFRATALSLLIAARPLAAACNAPYTASSLEKRPIIEIGRIKK